MKHWHEREFVIGGWSPAYGDHGWGLLVGEYDDEGALRFGGRVQWGITRTHREELEHMLGRSVIPGSPFADHRASAHEVFVEPTLSAEIRYLEMTSGGLLRHATFRHLGGRG